MEKVFIVLQDKKGKRLDTYLHESMPEFSRSKIQNVIEQGKVLVNGIVKKSCYHLKEGEKLSVSFEEIKDDLSVYNYNVSILYEDDDIIIVDKPAGLTVHPPHRAYSQTLVNALLAMKKELSNVAPLRRGIVHRLDKETSGVLIVAKNNRSHYNLIKQFQIRSIKKEYRAIVWGSVIKEHLVVDLPLARDVRNRLKMKISFINAKAAYTEIDVIKRFPDSTFLALTPVTGRMHQLRVHLNFLGHPIVGDSKYGKRDSLSELLLHAYRISFNHPTTQQWISFVAPLPQRFNDFIQPRIALT